MKRLRADNDSNDRYDAPQVTGEDPPTGSMEGATVSGRQVFFPGDEEVCGLTSRFQVTICC